MKIWSFSTVKNEEDIIESFVRYTMNIVDGMVISDNSSNDNTLDILKKLKTEGYNIDILVDPSKNFEQTSKRNELMNYTIKKYNPDYVFPLDADEFISSYKNVNPRKIIENLDQKYLYKYKMNNYILCGKENKNELFIPKKINKLRIEVESQKHNYKCFISKEVYSKGIFLEIGSHSASATSGDNSSIPIKINEDLFLAHFPVRNKEQIMNKVIIGRLNNSSIHSRDENLGWHQYEILDEIIKYGTISKKTLLHFSKYYSISDKNLKITSIYKPIYLDFCKDLEIKYHSKINNTKILSQTIIISEDIINNMREKLKIKNEEINKINKIIKEKDNIINEIQKEKEFYKDSFNRIFNSKTWKLKTKIDKFLKRI